MERSTQPKPEQDTSDTENVCMIRNECAKKVKGETEIDEMVSKIKKEFSDLDGSGFKNLGKVMLKQPAMNTGNAIPVISLLVECLII